MCECTNQRIGATPRILSGLMGLSSDFWAQNFVYLLHSVFLLPHDRYVKRKLPTTKSSSGKLARRQPRPFGYTNPTKDQLYAMLTDAWKNTQELSKRRKVGAVK